MALWGKTDTRSSAPKYQIDGANTSVVASPDLARDYGGLPEQVDLNNTYFVDTTEAAQAGNRARGIKSPGWTVYKEYGNGRHYVETLVAMRVSAADAGDAGITGNTSIEDLVVVDRTITISVQPANRSVVATNTAAFSVTAAASPTASLTYQWQIQQSGTGAWANVATGTGGTTANYTTGSTAVAPGSGATNGDRYRVIVGAVGAASVTSDAATLTVTAS